MFFEPNQSQFDLRFRLFGIGVRVHPWFWIISAAFGWQGGPDQQGQMFLPLLLLWIVCMFVSILIHEMGYVLVGRLFGSDGHIVLYGMGGLAVGSNALDRRWQRIAVCAAGPAADFVLLALVATVLYLSRDALPGLSPLVRELIAAAFGYLVWINLVWGLVNLLPVWPLDGGQISRDVCSGVWRDRGVRISLGISTLVAALIAVHAAAVILSESYRHRLHELALEWGHWLGFLLGFGDWFVVLFFGLLALGSFRTLQLLERQQHEWDEHWDE